MKTKSGDSNFMNALVFGIGVVVVLALSLVLDTMESWAADSSLNFHWKGERMRVEFPSQQLARIVNADGQVQAVCERRNPVDFVCKDKGLGQLTTHMALLPAGQIRFGTWVQGYQTASIR